MKTTMIKCISASAMIASVVTFGAVDADRQAMKTENAIRDAVAQMDARIKSAKTLDNKPIYLFMIGEDKKANALCEQLLQESLVKNNKVSVLADDDKDERLLRVLKHMEKSYTDQNGGVGAFKRETAAANELGHLLNAQVLLEAHLKVKTYGGSKRVDVSLGLMAYEIRTKRYIWIENIGGRRVDPFGSNDNPPEPAQLTKESVNVFVKAIPTDSDSSAIAQAIASGVSGALAKRGYTMQGTVRKPDVTLELRVGRDSYDKMGNFRVFNGSVSAKARLNGLNGTPGRDLGERFFDDRSKRGLGVTEAEKSLAEKLVPKVEEWAAEVIAPDALKLVAESVVLRFAEQDNDAAALSSMEQFRRTVEALPGVRTFEVMTKTVNNGIATVTFRAVYAKDRYRGGILAGAFSEKPGLANLLLAD